MTAQHEVGKWGHRRDLSALTPAEQATADAARAELDTAAAALAGLLAPVSDPPVWAEQPHHRQARQRTDAEQAALTRTEADPCSS